MRAHKSVCPYCKQLIRSLADLEIDHIIPESVKGERLTALLNELGKPDLDIQSYHNWFPVHRWCNQSKRAIIAVDASLHFFLTIAEAKVPSVLEQERRFERDALASDALATVAWQIETGALTIETVTAVLRSARSSEKSRFDPTILSFSLNLAEAATSDPKYDVPREIVAGRELDDSSRPPFTDETLEAELRSGLSSLKAIIVRSEAIQNNGETLSVRYAVWPLDLDYLPDRFPNAWELLEIAPFSEVYPGADAGELMDKGVILRRNELIVDADSDDPLPYRYCPMCASSELYKSSYSTPNGTVYVIRCYCGWTERF